MAKNNNLHTAKSAKKDEFYTQLTDIEKEMRHYKEFFRGKTVLCNCGDAIHHNFGKFFAMNFEALGLKKLICTSFNMDGSPASVAYYYGDKNGNHVPDPDEWDIRPLVGNGDFRSEECVELLKESDVVVSNPPFSLFREYVAQLIKYDKKFIIIGNQNAITYKEIFPLIKENKLWLGVSMNGSNRWFEVPDDYEVKDNAAGYKEENGKRYLFVNGVVWFTNVEHNKRNAGIDLFRKFSSEDYPCYDNYDAVECSRVENIPLDYNGVIGVPITFLHKYCPEQFEIIKFRKGDDDKDLSVNGKCPYFRILIRRKA